jgi:DNA-binding HxlR family transcriptional regulator
MRVDPLSGIVINVLNPDCPSRKTLELLADKWTLLIIVGLAKKGKLRNSQLKRGLGDISQKMLTQTLRNLETHGIVNRISYNQIPPKVEYELTELGNSLMEPIQALASWAELHYADVLEARQRSESAESDEAAS